MRMPLTSFDKTRIRFRTTLQAMHVSRLATVLAVRAFRARYRRRVLPANYSGLAHISFLIIIGVGGIIATIVLASTSWRMGDLWIVPVALLMANAVEYTTNRGPMHRRTHTMQVLSKRHLGRHHCFYVADAMSFESTRDFHAVLFPPVLLFFFGFIVTGLGLLATVFLSRTAAALFLATVLVYYVLYEILHLLCHSPPHWRLRRIPGIRRVAALHRLHHDLARTEQCNLNLAFPLFDWILGTLNTGQDQPESAMTRQEESDNELHLPPIQD